MDEYDTLKLQLMNEWFNLERDIANGTIDRIKVARRDFIEQTLVQEYHVEVRRRENNRCR